MVQLMTMELSVLSDLQTKSFPFPYCLQEAEVPKLFSSDRLLKEEQYGINFCLSKLVAQIRVFLWIS